jgi:hypothetical protein
VHTFLSMIAVACVVFGAISLLSSIFTEESDGMKLVARTLRSVAFLMLAGLLNSYVSFGLYDRD